MYRLVGWDDFYVAKKMINSVSKAKSQSNKFHFENLNEAKGKFDFMFSNFGGLNCTDDLKKVTKHISGLLNLGGVVTLVIMPRVCLWEWLWLFKGKFKNAFRRLDSKGADSHPEGHYFSTYYFSLKQVEEAMGKEFKLIKVESLGCISPPPSAINFVAAFPRFTKFLNQIDVVISKVFPFSRWGDHLIVTFQLTVRNKKSRLDQNSKRDFFLNTTIKQLQNSDSRSHRIEPRNWHSTSFSAPALLPQSTF